VSSGDAIAPAAPLALDDPGLARTDIEVRRDPYWLRVGVV